MELTWWDRLKIGLVSLTIKDLEIGLAVLAVAIFFYWLETPREERQGFGVIASIIAALVLFLRFLDWIKEPTVISPDPAAQAYSWGDFALDMLILAAMLLIVLLASGSGITWKKQK